MREQLIQYVKLLFAGVSDSEEMQQEILQNTLDRYDDLISQGKSPEAAYRLAISGIGDINEILGNPPSLHQDDPLRQTIHHEVEDIRSRNIRAVAVAMYILCAVPLFIFSEFGLDTMGLCFTLVLVAAATALMILSKKPGKDVEDERKNQPAELTPRQKLNNSISALVWSIGVAVYLIISFITGAWHITWIIFLILPCVTSLIQAIRDLKEANEYEN